MDAETRPGFDLLAMLAGALTFAMMIVYIVVIDQQDGQPAVWFVAALAVGALARCTRSSRSAPYRGVALVMSGVVLLLMGGLGILTIGLPILVAGVLALVAAVRSRRDATIRVP